MLKWCDDFQSFIGGARSYAVTWAKLRLNLSVSKSIDIEYDVDILIKSIWTGDIESWSVVHFCEIETNSIIL